MGGFQLGSHGHSKNLSRGYHYLGNPTGPAMPPSRVVDAKSEWRDGPLPPSCRTPPRLLRTVGLWMAILHITFSAAMAGEAAKFTLQDVRVFTPAQDFVVEYPGKSFPLGSSFQ